MNENSYICKFISRHSDWETMLSEQYGIFIRREGSLALFKYNIECDFTDPIVQEARGIIIDVDALEVVCWPFRKFGNYNESYADEIDWSSARVQEKVDGSIIKLWYDRKKSDWQFSTNGTIRAKEALVGENGKNNFGDVIRMAVNYADIPFSELDQDKTYIFELVSPITQIVVPYEVTMLYHIGTRHNITGMETEENIGIRKPACYSLHSLDECIKAATKLNSSMRKFSEVEQEGFVVVDKNWNRVKIKSPDYLAAHYVSTIRMTKKNVITFLRENHISVKELCDMNPSAAAVIKYYDYRMTELDLAADEIGKMAKTLYEEYQHDRKLVAKVLIRNPLGKIGFWCIDHEEPGHVYLSQLSLSSYCKLIPEYVSESVSQLFKESTEEMKE
ncbi:MAG: RNA ligase [Lachnospiraceae bacterium]